VFIFTGGTEKMPENLPFTVSSFYKFVSEKRLMAAKCNECGTVLLPPQPMCTHCLSTNLEWNELKGTGKLVTYTVIYVAPEQFQSMAPYAVGIVELKNGLRLPGIVCGVEPENIRVGMNLKIDFDQSTSSQWPAWPRYFFKPPE
jgi:uncharacterized protein